VRSVGLVVGPKGSTVKRIQQLTQTYIVTPSRGTEPVFEVVGAPDNVERARREIECRVQQQQQQQRGSTIRSPSGPAAPGSIDLPSATTLVGCPWTNPASSTSLGFPDVMISSGGDEFRRGAGFPPLQSDPLPLVDVWNHRGGGVGGLRSTDPAVPRPGVGLTDLLGGLGLLSDPASLLDGDEGIGSLSPDPLGFDGGSPWSRTAAGGGLTATALGVESTSGSTARRSWIDVDPLTSGAAGLELSGRLGAALDWSGNCAALRYTDTDSPMDCISVTPPRSPMACLFG